MGPHSATARCCPIYLQVFQEKYQELVKKIQNKLLTAQLINHQPTAITPTSNIVDYQDETWANIQEVALAADTPIEFVTLYTLAKLSAPKRPFKSKIYNANITSPLPSHMDQTWRWKLKKRTIHWKLSLKKRMM